MNTQDSKQIRWPSRIALMVAHCAGMVDLVALPVWVGTLITRYGLDPQQAGTLATLFLLGAVGSSLYCAPRFPRLPAARLAAAGFAVAALAFLGLTRATDFTTMAALHALAGAAAGSALSMTHGTIGRGYRPHRTFAMAGLALAVFGVVFLGAMPGVVAANGGPALFYAFSGVMLVATLVSLAAFPRAQPSARSAAGAAAPLSRAVWFTALGISCMGLVQAMTFSFVERIGADRGYAIGAVTGVLIALGLVNLLPAPLAALLEKRLPARTVVLAGPVIQATLALIITQGVCFASYAGATACFVAVMIFTHTFAFGLLAQLDPAGRALSATPAMLMTGAAIGPVLGGTLVKTSGYGSLGIAAAGIAVLSLYCFSQAGRQRAPALS